MGDNLFNFYVWTHSILLSGYFFESCIFLSETIFHFSKDVLVYNYSTNYTFMFTLKLATCLIFLASIRGGVPRYRYDFLTKMGWVKFLGLVLSVFISVFTLYLVW